MAISKDPATTQKSSRQNQKSVNDVDSNGGEEGKPVTKKHAKKENLKKRQKYDPRKAIEEAKKN